MVASVSCVREIALASVHIGVIVSSHERLLRWHRIIAGEEVLGGPVLAQGKERGGIVPAIAVGGPVRKTPAVARTVRFDEAP
jgi:hypothetical protein